MLPEIKILEEKKLIGFNLTMNLANNRTGELWRQFGPRIKEIDNRISSDKISLQLYDSSLDQGRDINSDFIKWAAVEVSTFDALPDGMQPFVLPGGLYAVFEYKGLSTNVSIFEYIFSTWLPQSAYLVDDRPHFELLGDKYKNNDPDSEEEIWIPIRHKKGV